MNRNQRESNRLNAAKLAQAAKAQRLLLHVCENCGQLGGHWVQTRPQSLEDIMLGRLDWGFWTCSQTLKIV